VFSLIAVLPPEPEFVIVLTQMLTKSLDEPGYSRKLTSLSDRHEPAFPEGLTYPKSSAPTPRPACTATNAASVVAASGRMCSVDSARICASGHGYPLASPRRRVAPYHDEDV